MGTKKRTKITEITVERSEVFVVGPAKKRVFAWCAQCAAETQLVTQAEAAPFAQVTARTIHHWVEAGRVHVTETAEGLLLVCLNSLFEKERKP